MSKTNSVVRGRNPADERANFLYKKILNEIIEPMVGSKSTYLSDLNKAGIMLFKQKFRGVYPSDKIPKLKKDEFAILNLDKSNQPGSHWIAIAKGKNTLVYDSFGRDDEEIIPNLKKSGNGKIINTDEDSEQNIMESNCGARCLSWLCVYDLWGEKLAKII